MLEIAIWELEDSGLNYKKDLFPSIFLSYYQFIQQIKYSRKLMKKLFGILFLSFALLFSLNVYAAKLPLFMIPEVNLINLLTN